MGGDRIIKRAVENKASQVQTVDKTRVTKLDDKYAPANMGMIARTKVGYKSHYLYSLLEIFDAPGGYKHAAEERGDKQNRGCRDVKYGGKPHMLDFMEMLKSV